MHNNPQLPKNQKFEWTIITKQKNERTGVTMKKREIRIRFCINHFLIWLCQLGTIKNKETLCYNKIPVLKVPYKIPCTKKKWTSNLEIIIRYSANREFFQRKNVKEITIVAKMSSFINKTVNKERGKKNYCKEKNIIL